MFGYDLNGFARSFSVGAIGATRETTDLIAPKIIRTWQVMTSQRAIAFYRQALTVAMAVCAVFVALGMIAREKMDGYVESCQIQGEDTATEKLEQVIAKVTAAAKWTRQQFTFDRFFSVAIRVILALIILSDRLKAFKQWIKSIRLGGAFLEFRA
jgi:hypothetical protein